MAQKRENKTCFVENMEDFTQKSTLTIEKGTENIDRVLSLSVDVCPTKTDVTHSNLLCEGELCGTLTYLTESGKIEVVTQKTPISFNIKNDSITELDKVSVSMSIKELGEIDLSPLKASTSVDVQCVPTLFKIEALEMFETGDDSLKQKYQAEHYTEYVGENNSLFTLKATSPIIENNSKPILTTVSLKLDSTEAINGGVKLVGESVFTVTLISEQEGGNVYSTLKFSQPFDEIVTVEDAAEGMMAIAKLNVVPSSIAAELIDDDNQTKLGISFDVFAQTKVLKEQEFMAVTDAYSLENKTTISTKMYLYNDKPIHIGGEEKFENNIMLDAELLRIDKLLFFGSEGVVLTNTYIQDDEFVIEGVAKVSIVYQNDETASANSYSAALPFQISKRLPEGEYEGAAFDVSAGIGELEVVCRRGREIYVDGKIIFNIICLANKKETVVSNVEISGELEKNTSPIRIYFANENETLWEIAKNMHEDENVIKAQNPDLKETIEEKTKIILYKQKI